MNTVILKYILVLNLLFFGINAAFCQISITEFPKNFQIYQRDLQDSCLVQVRGVASLPNVSSIKLQVLKNGSLFSEKTIFPTHSGVFSFDIKIKAGLFKYHFKLFQNQNQLVSEATNVLGGDIFLFYGQSNAIGYGPEMDNYTMPTDDYFRVLKVNDINYYNGSWEGISHPFLVYDTGMFPIEFLKEYRKKSTYPVGVIQSAYGGAPLSSLNDRDAGNVLNPTTRYGTMLRKLVLAGTKNNLKYMIFRQGEADTETSIGSTTYHLRFTEFMFNLQLDLPSLTHLFNFQVNILTNNFTSNPDAEVLREYQRIIPSLFSKIRAIASAGISGFDGLHYNLKGMKEAATSIAGIFVKEALNQTSSANVYSPNVSKIFFNSNKTKITLKFQKDMSMVFPDDSITVNQGGSQSLKKMTDAIYINGISGVVQNGIADANKIILTVPQVSVSQMITYLPNLTPNAYNGLFLKNTNGENALTFARKTISNPLLIPILAGTLNTDNSIQIFWNSTFQSGQIYHIEKSISTNNDFIEIGTSSQPFYSDTSTAPNTSYNYRIWAETDLSESEFSNTITLATRCPNTIILENSSTVLGYNEAASSIFSTCVLPNLSVIFQSKQILLLPGFATNSQNTFLATIGNCQ